MSSATSIQSASVVAPRRRWRFGLRTLLMLMAACCVLAACAKRYHDAAVAQAAAVKTLGELGLKVTYDFQVEAPTTLPDADSWWKWKWRKRNPVGVTDRLRDRVGVDLCGNVIALTAFEDGYFAERHVYETYAILKSLPRLRVIDIFDSYFCVEGLAHCVDHDELVSLNLCRTWVTDENVSVICRLPHVRTLGLDGSNITDAGAANLKAMRQLRYLWLTHTKVSPAMIAELRRALPGCHVIDDAEFEAMERTRNK